MDNKTRPGVNEEIENGNNCRSGFQNKQEKVESIEIIESQTSTETSVSCLNGQRWPIVLAL